MSADGWLGEAIKRRLLEQRGQHGRSYEKDAVDRFLGVVAHRLDPHLDAKNAASIREAGLSRFDRGVIGLKKIWIYPITLNFLWFRCGELPSGLGRPNTKNSPVPESLPDTAISILITGSDLFLMTIHSLIRDM